MDLAMLAQIKSHPGKSLAERQVVTHNMSTNYEFASLVQKFRARPWNEKWQHIWDILRGIIHSRQIDSPHLVLRGRGVVIEKRHGRITTGGVCVLRPACRIAVVGKEGQPAHLHIGQGTEVGDRTIINVSERIEIGVCCSISWDCDIGDSDFHQIILANDQRPPKTEPVIIEDNVWIGSHCLILKGVTIGHHAVIAAGSVVRNSVPPYSLMGGNPARRVGPILGWQR
jgi:acetyltransferase-like isoleucine patch superfamily enzyme